MIPFPLLRAYARKLPQLTAEDSLLATTRVAVGSGSLRRESAQRILGDWERAAAGPQRLGPTSPAERRANAALLGIRVVEEVADA